MKKKILTLGLFVALAFAATKMSNSSPVLGSTLFCLPWEIHCDNGTSHMGWVCGSLAEMAWQYDQFEDILCN